MMTATVNFVSEKGNQALLTVGDVSVRVSGRNIPATLLGCVVELDGDVSDVKEVQAFNRRTGNMVTRKQGTFVGKIVKVLQTPVDYAFLAVA